MMNRKRMRISSFTARLHQLGLIHPFPVHNFITVDGLGRSAVACDGNISGPVDHVGVVSGPECCIGHTLD